MLYTGLILFVAHILGDFVFQPKKWVDGRAHHIRYIFYHVGVHAALLCLFFIRDLSHWWPAIAVIVLSHLAIDSLKVSLERKMNSNPLLLFSIDQLLHLTVLAAVLGCHYGIPESFISSIWSVQAQILLIGFLLTAFVSPIVLRVFFSKWNQSAEVNAQRQDSLIDAGWIIGVLERLLIVFFVNINFLEGIGFLLAAKSIFRFGDLANAKDKKFTEYVLVGTLASFVMAIGIGFLIKWLLRMV
ncbi:DUF3307 domain-containing protein [Sphingobacterium spiritivorum]|uniref:DUF3307 domain-containing protein n=1 Tax=Sphingobacterium spiritivorum TaxID=258 RepID=UPI00191ABF25|nr:DUF3307 domain-containing protein [Sphingobacterium spiritivorum]QQT24886.1 DUF3307 domain-containing protein [Sphingobacterium spiritivorum]